MAAGIRKYLVCYRGEYMEIYNTDAKVPVKGILIRRQDGSPRGPYEVFLGTWEEADVILKFWAKNSSASGYVENCSFRVIFEDGNSYSGTYMLKPQDSFDRNLLPKRIVQICRETEIAWDAKAFLDKYDIPKAA
jgi:hypothetical protein